MLCHCWHITPKCMWVYLSCVLGIQASAFTILDTYLLWSFMFACRNLQRSEQVVWPDEGHFLQQSLSHAHLVSKTYLMVFWVMPLPCITGHLNCNSCNMVGWELPVVMCVYVFTYFVLHMFGEKLQKCTVMLMMSICLSTWVPSDWFSWNCVFWISTIIFQHSCLGSDYQHRFSLFPPHLKTETDPVSDMLWGF